MVRKVLLLTLAILALAAFSAFAASEGEGLPAGAVNPGTYQLDDDGNWVVATYAKSWNSNPASSGGISNKELHQVEIINHVSVAQWINWTISGTRKDWRVLRPGTYASNSVSATIQSNNDVVIEFWAEDPEYLSSGGVTRTIPKWFSYSTSADIEEVEENGWYRGSEFSEDNPLRIVISDSANLHAGITYKLWEKIEVVPSNSSSEYEGKGWLKIYLTNIKHWVDGEKGDFKEGGYGYLDEFHP